MAERDINLQATLEKVSKFIVSKGDAAFRSWSEITLDRHLDGVDISTNFDKSIEKEFSDYILANFPDHGFKGEEMPELDRPSDLIWYIDPIDGTKYFGAGIPLWSTTLALVCEGEPLLGVIYNPVSSQLYTAIKGCGAFLNNKKIEISTEHNISKLQVFFDLGSTSYQSPKLHEEANRIFPILHKNFYRTRMIGNGSLTLSWIANGFGAVMYDFARLDAKYVDIAGGLLIAKEAGAEIKEISLENGLTRRIIAHLKAIEQMERLGL
jgi:myo-inositol-1(or 4)-monophosphatase